MIMFLLQALLLLLIAFGLGYFLGRFLKKLFCKPEPMQRVNPNETSATIHADRKPLERLSPSPSATVSTAKVAAGAAAVAATGAALARKRLNADAHLDEPAGSINVADLEVTTPSMTLRSAETDLRYVDAKASGLDAELPKVDVDLKAPSLDIDLPNVDLKAPSLDVDLPKIDVDLPDVDLKAPSLAVDLPEVDLKAPSLDVDLPDVDLKAPSLDVDLPNIDVDLPDVDLKAPSIDVDLPDVDLKAPSLDVDLPNVDLKAPSIDVDLPDVKAPSLDVDLPKVDVDLPDVDLKAPSLDVDLPELTSSDSSLVDTAKAAVLAAGAGLAAKVVSATVSGEDTAQPVASVQAATATRVLWDDDAVADLEMLNSDEAVLLRPGDFQQLASVRCGVNKPGSVSVGSDVGHLAEGQAVLFPVYQVAVHRDDMERYTFVPLSAEAGTVDDRSVAILDAAVSAGADDFDAENDWLVLVRKALATGNRRPSLLWDADSAYDCSLLSGHEDAITLQHGKYDKLGSIHCGVTRPGALAVGGDVGYIEEGQAMLFPIYQIVACRDADGDHHFLRLTEPN